MRSINKIISITLLGLLFPLTIGAQNKHFEGEITYKMFILCFGHKLQGIQNS